MFQGRGGENCVRVEIKWGLLSVEIVTKRWENELVKRFYKGKKILIRILTLVKGVSSVDSVT